MRIFISHIHEEFALANAIKRQFDQIFADMVDVFLSEDIRPGDDWLFKIKTALQGADIILVLFSRASHSRPWINIEAGYGIMAEKSVVPICCLGMEKEKLPVIYSLRQALYLADISDAEKLLETIAALTAAKRLIAPDRQSLLNNWLAAIDNAIATMPLYRPPLDSPPLVWLIGSVNGVENESRDRAFRTADALAEAFIMRGYRIVLGRNQLLNYLGDKVVAEAIQQAPQGHHDLPHLLATKSARQPTLAPNPIIVLGTLRSTTGVKGIFYDSIGKVPDVAVLLGGSSGGRAVEEAQLASAAGIPVLPLTFTGGAAATVKSTFHTSLSKDVENVQAMFRGSDIIGRMVCDLIEKQSQLLRESMGAA